MTERQEALDGEGGFQPIFNSSSRDEPLVRRRLSWFGSPVRGEKKAERSDEAKFVSERYYGSFERQIPLDGVEEDRAQADFKNGVLTVTLPKSDKSNQNVKRIAINSN